MDSQTYIFSLISGVLCEVFLFSRGDWVQSSPTIAKGFTLLAISCTLIFWIGLGLTLTESFREMVLHGCALLSGLYSSMAIYRLFFHPLRAFPGPFGARVTAFWAFKESCPDLKFYEKLCKLHEQYGDFVRIRPREISICHPDAIMDVHGPRNKIRKAEFYSQIEPANSLQFTRDPAIHSRRRRHWDRAFQNKSLHEYEPRLRKHYSVLLDIFARHAASHNPIDVSEFFMFLGFDLVSELTFGKSFDTLSTGKPNEIMAEFVQSKKVIGFTILHMWFFYLLKMLPPVYERIEYWESWYRRELDKRKEMTLQSPDFYTHISQSEGFEEDRAHEAQLAIVAGSDTVAFTLTNICYLLCAYPDYQTKLFDEIKDLPVEGGIINDQHLVGKPYLLGIINESLRLHPPAGPAGLPRLTPPEGAVIAGRFIPGNTNITTPTYAIQRDKRAFIKPDDFIPERWSSQPELILRKDAFFPFSYGAYNCAGKPLAMMELRMILAMVFSRFEVTFAPGKEAECRRFAEEQADCFIMHTHPLPLTFKERD